MRLKGYSCIKDLQISFYIGSDWRVVKFYFTKYRGTLIIYTSIQHSIIF